MGTAANGRTPEEARVEALLDIAGDAIARYDLATLRTVVFLLADRISPRLFLLADSALQFLAEGDRPLAEQLWEQCSEAARADAQTRTGLV